MNLINLLIDNNLWWGLPTKLDFLKEIVTAIEGVLWPILIVVATVGSIYAVYLGINMAKAEDASKRDEAKKRVINAVIAMVVTVALIILIQTIVIPGIPKWVSNIDGKIIEKIEKIDSEYDTREEVESVVGAPHKTEESGASIYHIKIEGDNYTLTVTYDLSGKVTSVKKAVAGAE